MSTTTPEKPFLTRAEAAEFLTSHGYRTTKGTLQKKASTGGGPEYEIYGRDALYRPKVLLGWAQARMTRPKVKANSAA